MSKGTVTPQLMAASMYSFRKYLNCSPSFSSVDCASFLFDNTDRNAVELGSAEFVLRDKLRLLTPLKLLVWPELEGEMKGNISHTNTVLDCLMVKSCPAVSFSRFIIDPITLRGTANTTKSQSVGKTVSSATPFSHTNNLIIMSDLKSLKRPPISLIKLVESIGILLGVPRSTDKSAYKAPLPSNYDKTVELLSNNFYDKVQTLSNVVSAQIPNDVASLFYNKTLEPGFDYEEAVNAGGLMVRELFNIVYLVLLGLQTDENRVPVTEDSITVLVDGTRSSYAALDAAAHVHDHGLLNIITFLTSNDDESDDQLIEVHRNHLVSDMTRRCKSHYKKAEHCYNITSITMRASDVSTQQIQTVRRALEELSCTVFVLGMPDCNIGEGSSSAAALAKWAVWEHSGDVVLCKGLSNVRPFTAVAVPRNYLLYVDSSHDPRQVFFKALKFLRPGDSLVLFTLVATRDPVGDNRDMRFDFGVRSGWVEEGAVPRGNEADRSGWNDEQVGELTARLENMLSSSYLIGKVVVSRYSAQHSVAQSLCQTALEEGVDSVLLGLQHNTDLIVETARESCCSLIVLK